jgi:hypothetical protein
MFHLRFNKIIMLLNTVLLLNQIEIFSFAMFDPIEIMHEAESNNWKVMSYDKTNALQKKNCHKSVLKHICHV